MAATLSQHQILKAENMRAAFMHFDTDNSGTISKDELREALKVRGLRERWRRVRAALRCRRVDCAEAEDIMPAFSFPRQR